MKRRRKNKRKGRGNGTRDLEARGRTTKVRRRAGERCTTRNQKPIRFAQ